MRLAQLWRVLLAVALAVTCVCSSAPPVHAADAGVTTPAALVFFWGVGCPHCEEAKSFVDALERQEPSLRIERVEVRRDPAGRERFVETMKRLGQTTAGVPTFVVGTDVVVGYARGETDQEVTALVRAALGRPKGTAAGAEPGRALELPLLGRVEPASVSLPALTITMGLVDGVNPCAMWVLIVLLGLLLHVEQRARMFLFAGTFIAMSAVVYFLFMTAWSAVFGLIGLSRTATMILGGALVAMGIVNLKELVWFKKGPSLMIPAKAKPGLFRRMRAVVGAANVPVALAGIVGLAFVVNLIELGCTIGLPAVYTRILTSRDTSTIARYGYLALYNVAYVVPLIAIAVTFIALRRRLVLTESAAKALKAISGTVLTVFGAVFLFAPDVALRL